MTVFVIWRAAFGSIAGPEMSLEGALYIFFFISFVGCFVGICSRAGGGGSSFDAALARHRKLGVKHLGSERLLSICIWKKLFRLVERDPMVYGIFR